MHTISTERCVVSRNYSKKAKDAMKDKLKRHVCGKRSPEMKNATRKRRRRGSSLEDLMGIRSLLIYFAGWTFTRHQDTECNAPEREEK